MRTKVFWLGRNVASFALVGLMAFVVSCSAPTVYSPPAYGAPPIPARILLLIPDDFASFSYSSLIDGRETVHPFGQEAQEEFRRILGPQFQFMAMRPVRSEAAALDMLAPDNPENADVRGYDYVGIPRFESANSMRNGSEYRFTVEVILQLRTFDGASVTALKGTGESVTGLYAKRGPLEAGESAVRSAVEAIGDGINQKRGVFISMSGRNVPEPSRRAPLPPQQPSYSERPLPPSEWVESSAADAPAVVAIPVKVLAAFPDEFSQFVYSSYIGGGEVRRDLGREAEDVMSRLITPKFQSFTIEYVRSEGEAMRMLSREDPDSAAARGFDFVAVPRFVKVDSWSEPARYGYTVDVVLVFHPTGDLREVTIKGHGEASADPYGATPSQVGGRALRSAISAIGASIDRDANLFAY